MKYLLNKQTRQKFLSDNWKLETLVFKWTTSKGRNTYGWNICTLKDRRGNKISSTCGGGYDMKGTAFGDFIADYFGEQLKRLTANYGSFDKGGFYGLRHYNTITRKSQKRASKHTRTTIDGACGFNCMLTILEKIGFSLTFIAEDKDTSIYQLKLK
tara:strand:+ start:176 stop:643 length:468 start_codon:yes stop_codon:yes gene_type:complete